MKGSYKTIETFDTKNSQNTENNKIVMFMTVILKDFSNFQALIMVLLQIFPVQLSQATLLISQINENHGFIEIKTGDVKHVQ